MSLVSMFVFPAPEPSYTMHSFPNELVWFPLSPADASPNSASMSPGKCKPGDSVPAVILRFLIIYLHSNGEDIGLSYAFGCGLRMVLEVHVLLVEYPGYGICPGECSEESLWEVARAAYRFATETLRWPYEDVIIMGRSLGASLAMRLAGTYACHGIILVAPFLTLSEVIGQYVGGLAPMLVGDDSFNNRELIRHVKLPTLIIHGTDDKLVSCSHGQELWETCPCKKKLLVCPHQMSHNSDLLSNADFLIRPMLRFFALPDYCFVDLEIPAEAFDKRNCPQYHKLVETVKNDKPLLRPQGDKEPCPVYTTTGGPQSDNGLMVAAGGDDDDLEESNEHSVKSPREDEHSLKLPAVDDFVPAALETEMTMMSGAMSEILDFWTYEQRVHGLSDLHGREGEPPRMPGLSTRSTTCHGPTQALAIGRGLPVDLGLDIFPRAAEEPEVECVIRAGKGIAEEPEIDFVARAGKGPMLLCTKARAHPCGDETVAATTAAAWAESACLSDEGSTSPPSIAEASVSRWSEDTSDPLCKGNPVPGVGPLNLKDVTTGVWNQVDACEINM